MKRTEKPMECNALIPSQLTTEHVGTHKAVLNSIALTDKGNTVFNFRFPSLDNAKNTFNQSIIFNGQGLTNITDTFIFMNHKDLPKTNADYKAYNKEFPLSVAYLDKTRDGFIEKHETFDSLSDYKILDASIKKLYAIFSQAGLSYPTHIDEVNDFDSYCKYMCSIDYSIGVFATRNGKVHLADAKYAERMNNENNGNSNTRKRAIIRR
tara:strand:+ start:8252 stop:8878 length:627 start_codon:yes stop_codon:yes gene_type:complete